MRQLQKHPPLHQWKPHPVEGEAPAARRDEPEAVFAELQPPVNHPFPLPPPLSVSLSLLWLVKFKALVFSPPGSKRLQGPFCTRKQNTHHKTRTRANECTERRYYIFHFIKREKRVRTSHGRLKYKACLMKYHYGRKY